MKHTPGPWKVDYRYTCEDEDGPFGDNWPDVRTLDGSQIICMTPQAVQDIPEARANARILAVSPDMFAVIKEMVSCRSDCNDRNCGECTHCKALATIAKAEGAE